MSLLYVALELTETSVNVICVSFDEHEVKAQIKIAGDHISETVDYAYIEVPIPPEGETTMTIIEVQNAQIGDKLICTYYRDPLHVEKIEQIHEGWYCLSFLDMSFSLYVPGDFQLYKEA
jgi:hypothetical protein